MMLQLGLLALMAACGGIGSVLRYLLGGWQGFVPWGILTGNVFASIVFGFALNNQVPLGWSPYVLPLLATGLAGGLSTFSSWAAQTAGFLTSKLTRRALLNTLLNLVLPVAGVIAGMFIAPILLK
jgi:CrcB protein